VQVCRVPGNCWERIVPAKVLGDAAATALRNKTSPERQHLEIHDLNAAASCHCANLQQAAV